MQSSAPTDNQLLELIPRHLNEDLKQDIYVALREAAPATEEEAETIINRVRNRDRYKARADRQRTRGCDIETATVNSGGMTVASQLLNLLDPADRTILVDRFISGLPVSECAARLGVSQPTYRKRLGEVLERAKKNCSGLSFLTPANTY